MFKSVLFVCIGNICRSPAAEGLLKHYSDMYNLDLRVSSAGVHALVGQSPQPHSQAVCAEHGVDISGYRAEQVTQEMILNNDLCIVLDEVVRRDLVSRYPFATGKVKKLGFLDDEMDIDDPYRKDKSAFDEMYYNIDHCLKSWLRKIWSVEL